ncbi:MAG: hypothetical protein U0610_30615 [bacterium]
MKPTKHRHIVLSLILLACSFANHANATECKQSDLLSECLRSFMEATKERARSFSRDGGIWRGSGKTGA